MFFAVTTSGINFTNVVLNHNKRGIYFDSTSNIVGNVRFVNFSIWNCSDTSQGCFFAEWGIDSSSFINGTINQSGKHLIYIQSLLLNLERVRLTFHP